VFGVSDLISNVHLVSSVFVSVSSSLLLLFCVVVCTFVVGSSVFISLGTLRSSIGHNAHKVLTIAVFLLMSKTSKVSFRIRYLRMSNS